MDQAELLTEHIYALTIFLILSVILLSIAWWKHYFVMPRDEVVTPPISLLRVITGFILYFGSQLFLGPFIWILSFIVLHGRIPDNNDLMLDTISQGWFNLLNIVIAGGVLGIYLLTFKQQTLHYLWGGRKKGIQNRVHDFLMGAMTWFLAYPTVIAVQQIVAILVLLNYPGPRIDQVAVKQFKSTGESPILFFATAFLIVTLIPIMEEFLFRGLLQTWLKKRMKTIYAIIIASIIFSLFHFSITQGNANMELLASLFVLGCFLGFIYERQRSLWASIGLHATFNGISVLMILFTKE